METVITISRIEDRLRRLSPDGLEAVYDFMSCLLDREGEELLATTDSDPFQTMFDSEKVLRPDRGRTEETAAWADL
jgi:hypothetical protein